jgi:hypothetical protein
MALAKPEERKARQNKKCFFALMYGKIRDRDKLSQKCHREGWEYGR